MSTVDDAVEQGVAVSRPPRLLARMMRQRQAKVGMVLTLAVLLVALAGPLLLPWLTGHTSTEFTGRPFTDTGMFGTDNLGRDVLSRFLDGGLRLIIYAALATALGMVVGVAVGMTAAYSRGRVDALIMRGNDVLLALPQLVFVAAQRFF